jgi:hypothetical protein
MIIVCGREQERGGRRGLPGSVDHALGGWYGGFGLVRHVPCRCLGLGGRGPGRPAASGFARRGFPPRSIMPSATPTMMTPPAAWAGRIDSPLTTTAPMTPKTGTRLRMFTATLDAILRRP